MKQLINDCVVFPAANQAELRQEAVPELKADEVLVESVYSVVSAGTEGANLRHEPNTVTAEYGFPHYPGYSTAGRVIQTGTAVTVLAVGDRVIVPWGGHRRYTVKKADQLYPVTDDAIDLRDAAVAHIASFSLLGVRKLKLELGESCVVAGMGILGAFAVQFARLSGAVEVIALDFDPARQKLAIALGATAAFSPDDPELTAKVRAITNGGPDAVVEVTGAAKALQQALEYIAWEGRISLLGCTRVSDVPIDFYQFVHRRGITLVGAHTFTRAKLESAPGRWTEFDDYRTILKLVAAGRLEAKSLIAETVSPTAAPEVYARLADRKNAVPLGIMFDWQQLK